jgi:hypothetical protein
LLLGFERLGDLGLKGVRSDLLRRHHRMSERREQKREGEAGGRQGDEGTRLSPPGTDDNVAAIDETEIGPRVGRRVDAGLLSLRSSLVLRLLPKGASRRSAPLRRALADLGLAATSWVEGRRAPRVSRRTAGIAPQTHPISGGHVQPPVAAVAKRPFTRRSSPEW